MTYISLYRKYRSRTFDEIVGQRHITTTLKNAIEAGRISHAYLFSGPRGTGKTSTARIFAKALNCEKGPTPEPCNACDICDSITRDVLFDVIEIDAASNRGIDDIRELKEKVRVPPAQARYKIYIIDEVHMLTREAFNALLKTLEEPPPNVIFMLATTEAHKLLATILSRCQRYDFRRISTEGIRAHLADIASRENFEVEPQALDVIAAVADGAMRDAISILDQLVSYSGGKITAAHVSEVLGMIPGGEMAAFIDAALDNDAAAAFKLLDRFFQEGKSASLFIRMLLEHLRNIYFVHAGIPVETADAAMVEAVRRQASRVSAQDVARLLDDAAKVEDRIRWENYPRIVLEIMAVKFLNTLHAGAVAEPREPRPAPPPRRPEAAPPPPPPRPAPAAPPEPVEEEPSPLADEEPALPPPPPAIEGELNLEKINAHWADFLLALKQESIPACIILSSGAPAAFDGDALTVGFDKGHQFHKEQIQERGNSDRIEKALAKFFGKEIKVRSRFVSRDSDDSEEPKPPAKKSKPAAEAAPPPPPKEKKQPQTLLDLVQQHFPNGKEV